MMWSTANQIYTSSQIKVRDEDDLIERGREREREKFSV